jgi:hypothetical protein
MTKNLATQTVVPKHRLFRRAVAGTFMLAVAIPLTAGSAQAAAGSGDYAGNLCNRSDTRTATFTTGGETCVSLGGFTPWSQITLAPIAYDGLADGYRVEHYSQVQQYLPSRGWYSPNAMQTFTTQGAGITKVGNYRSIGRYLNASHFRFVVSACRVNSSGARINCDTAYSPAYNWSGN